MEILSEAKFFSCWTFRGSFKANFSDFNECPTPSKIKFKTFPLLVTFQKFTTHFNLFNFPSQSRICPSNLSHAPFAPFFKFVSFFLASPPEKLNSFSSRKRDTRNEQKKSRSSVLSLPETPWECTARKNPHVNHEWEGGQRRKTST